MLRTLSVLLASSLLATTASAQLIRPQSATAGSEFSSSYDIAQAIDGSGLPSLFTLASIHDDYVAGNHWTTRSGAIGNGTAFAEFFFIQPQILGQFHLWNHRSNNIANNPYYSVTQFDLIFRDASGSTISEVLNCNSIGGLNDGSSQTFHFPEVHGVSSVLFRIDTNSQPSGGAASYTGVAEVAFGPSVNIGTNYCDAAPNSTNQEALIIATGSRLIAQNDVTLQARKLPTNQFGFFLTSQNQFFLANPGGSQGNLCIGSNLGRYNQANAIQFSGTIGEFSYQIDLTDMPTNPHQSALAGQTWNFQAWFRDQNPGSTSNFTDGVAITFM